jgi:hypothetical protein
MKRFVLIISLFLLGLTAKAQYHHYNPYLYASIAAETDDTYRLNNIRFDEYALMQNPSAWSAYKDYLSWNEAYLKKRKIYNAVAWTGLGVMGASLIPTMASVDSPNDGMMILGIGMLGAGTIAACIGYCGASSMNGKIKGNKKDFIYYLKTTNNGIGIVSIF